MILAEVVAAARGWIGTPYAHQHRMKGVAVDCGGLVIGIVRELGLFPADFDINGYARTPDGVSLVAYCDEHMDRIPRSRMQPGNIICGRFDKDPQHIAILGDYLHGGLSIIHALNRANGKGCVIEQRFDVRLPFKIVQTYALRGVA